MTYRHLTAILAVAALACGRVEKKTDEPEATAPSAEPVVQPARPKFTEEQKTQARGLFRDVTALRDAARAMEALRADPKKLRECGEAMRKYQPQAEALSKRSNALPTALGFHVGVAANYLVLGCSCLPTAAKQVALADGMLEQFTEWYTEEFGAAP